jgi:hypothetical protein
MSDLVIKFAEMIKIHNDLLKMDNAVTDEYNIRLNELMNYISNINFENVDDEFMVEFVEEKDKLIDNVKEIAVHLLNSSTSLYEHVFKMVDFMVEHKGELFNGDESAINDFRNVLESYSKSIEVAKNAINMNSNA